MHGSGTVSVLHDRIPPARLVQFPVLVKRWDVSDRHPRLQVCGGAEPNLLPDRIAIDVFAVVDDVPSVVSRVQVRGMCTQPFPGVLGALLHIIQVAVAIHTC